uniref:Uncharacterized protein n=1 Tax=Arundo donax TaxID=35708 RepID=A0A0A9HIZ6_ARUDO
MRGRAQRQGRERSDKMGSSLLSVRIRAFLDEVDLEEKVEVTAEARVGREAASPATRRGCVP